MQQNDKENIITDNEESFEDLLKGNYANNEYFEPGQLVEAQVVKISGEWIFLHTGGKSEGYLEASEMTDDKGKISVKEGDFINAYFLSANNGEMHFTTKIGSGKTGQKILQSAYDNDIPVEGFVNKEIKGGYEITIGTTRAFCPYSQIGLERVEPEKYIGKKFNFKITEIDENGRNIILSNRIILEEERKIKVNTLKESLKQSMRVKCTIKSIQDFGAFVDLGGVHALIPISEISRGRVENIHDYLKVGQEIEAVILNLDWDKEKISLSIKETLQDPWKEADQKYVAGSKYPGKIVRITNFGAFVTLEPGLDGLLHISDLGGGTKIKHPREVVKEGDSLEVIIGQVDINQKRISLKLANTKKENEDENYDQFMGKRNDSYNPFGNIGNLIKKKDTN